jgi:hypothetical protein
MSLDDRIKDALAEGAFDRLFLGELGWDRPRLGGFRVESAGSTYEVRAVAQKSGLHVFDIEAPEIPPAAAQATADREAAKRSPERLLVFRTPIRQIWRWPETRPSGGTRLVPHEYRIGSPNEDLVQRLARISFSPDEQETLTLADVRARVRLSLSAEQVTKRFYEAFRVHHGDLLAGIEGIDDEEDRSWYASLLMNRLMFIYFIQMKGFIGGDREFLRRCLTRVRELKGKDEFYAFYRDLLIPLFHDGLGSSAHAYPDPDIAGLLVHVPYVNGGIFEAHSIERRYTIRVRDEYFERIFGFFDGFAWHLDTRPTGNPNEINPDVLGYVFEQYINLTASGRRENGAYYTKQDVTGYMAGATLIPRLLRRLIERTGVNPFAHLQASPDLYIHEDLRYGWDVGMSEWTSAPREATEAFTDPARWPELGDLDRDAGVLLPGETWLDLFERRKRVDDLRSRITDGSVSSVESLITENLDLRALLIDTIRALGSPEAIRSVWEETTSTTVLDPTCGSGAFLFAALDILDDVYAAILETAELHVRTGAPHAREALEQITARRKQGQNVAYFRLKHACLSNLYGLDIMEEAVEIAKLRLFLTLAARLERRDEIEPLPDLDFNLKAGNLLVGFHDLEDARRRIADDLVSLHAVEALVPEATELVTRRAEFVAHLERASDEFEAARLKADITSATEALRAAADHAYWTSEGSRGSLDEWREVSRPFHWFIEFPHVTSRGGFDVVVGNPPYVPRSDVQYAISGLKTANDSDIFAPCMERSSALVRDNGLFSMIVPIAFQFRTDNKIARRTLAEALPWRCVSTYSRNPSALFTAGLGVRSVIVLGAKSLESRLHVTETRRWVEDFRPSLFHGTRYSELSFEPGDAPWPRLGSAGLVELYGALTSLRQPLGVDVRRHGEELGFKKTALYYLVFWIDEPPAWLPSGERVTRPLGTLWFDTAEARDIAFVLLSGRLAVWWWATTGDDFNVTAQLPKSFPVCVGAVNGARDELLRLAKELRREQPLHPIVTLYAGKEMGNYDMLRCRHVTDQADELVLETLGLGQYWPEILAADARFLRMTGERPGTEREWPFPWEPGT